MVNHYKEFLKVKKVLIIIDKDFGSPVNYLKGFFLLKFTSYVPSLLLFLYTSIHLM